MQTERAQAGQGLPAAETSNGAAYGFSAYLIWGFLPLFFRLLDHVGSLEIVAHRVIWSVAFLALLLAIYRMFPALLDALRRPRIVGSG